MYRPKDSEIQKVHLPGDSFGISTLLFEQKNSKNALNVQGGDCTSTVYSLSRKDFVQLLARHPFLRSVALAEMLARSSLFENIHRSREGRVVLLKMCGSLRLIELQARKW